MRLHTALNILGLSPPITQEDIKKQFRKSVKRCDPSLSNKDDVQLRLMIEAKQFLLNNFDFYFTTSKTAPGPKECKTKTQPKSTPKDPNTYAPGNKLYVKIKKTLLPTFYMCIPIIILIVSGLLLSMVDNKLRQTNNLKQTNSYLTILRKNIPITTINKTLEEEKKSYPPILATDYFIFEGDFTQTTPVGYTIKLLWEYDHPKTGKILVRDEFQSSVVVIDLDINRKVPQVEFKFDPTVTSSMTDDRYEAKGYNSISGLLAFLKVYRTKVIIHCPPNKWPKNIYLPSNPKEMLYF